MLAAAEYVLARHGHEEFTIGAVADWTGLSVGAIYRRFAGKDQLLTRLETNVAEALGESGPHDVVAAFTRALADTFAAHDRIFPELLDGQRADGRERGLQALATIQQAFVEAAGDSKAVRMTARTVIGACVHRAATCGYWPDGLDWTTWAAETTELALAYLAAAK